MYFDSAVVNEGGRLAPLRGVGELAGWRILWVRAVLALPFERNASIRTELEAGWCGDAWEGECVGKGG